MRAGMYPAQDPNQPVPAVPQGGGVAATPTTAPQAPAPMAPAPAAPAPVYAGTEAMGADPNGDGAGGRGDSEIGSRGDGSLTGLGPNPGNLGNLSGFGISGYGQLGSALGGLAGLGLGAPGLSALGGLAGTYADVSNLNSQLTGMGLAPSIGFADAAVNNATFGLAGQSAEDQFGAGIGFDAFAEAPLSAFNETPAAAPQDAPLSAADFGGFATAADHGAADAQGSGTGGFGATDSSDFGGYGGESQFMAGGYTGHGGDGVVEITEPAGTVHEGEVVIPADKVDAYGLPLLMMLVNGEIPPSRLAELARPQ